MNKLYIDQTDKLDKLLREGYTPKDINASVYKLRSIITGLKIQPPELACINNPETRELITCTEQIKQTTLKHNIKILTQDPKR